MKRRWDNGRIPSFAFSWKRALAGWAGFLILAGVSAAGQRTFRPRLRPDEIAYLQERRDSDLRIISTTDGLLKARSTADRAELYCLFESQKLSQAPMVHEANLQQYGDPFAKYQRFDVEGCEVNAIQGEAEIPTQNWLWNYRRAAVAEIADISEKLGQPVPRLPEPARPRNSIPRNAKPERLKYRDPEYTQAATDAHYQGTVHVRLGITARGAVASIQILDPPGFGMEGSILRTLSGWHFRPAMQNGDPVPADSDVILTFQRF